MEEPDLCGAEFSGVRIERLLARGGMGAVYLGHTASGEPRALKFLAPEVSRDPALQQRFEREGQSLEKVPPHPNVVRVYGVHRDELLDQPYLLMEVLEGRSLEELLRSGAQFDPSRAIQIGISAARGLGALHQAGLIHRDVKPGNLVELSRGGLKVVDLGLAKDLFLSGLTQPDRVVGTITYMAPEQWRGGEVGPATDVFGLGATLYHLLCGAPPFRGDISTIQRACTSGAWDPLSARAPHVPAALAQVVERMLALDPSERYPRMDSVIRALVEALGGGESRGDPYLVLVGGGRRWVLSGSRHFGIGSAADQPVRLEDPSVAPRHARLSHKQRGFVLRGLRDTSGTWVSEEPVGEQPRLLTDGDLLRFGAVELRFVLPDGDRPPAYLSDVERAPASPETLAELVAKDDPRSVLWCLEQLALSSRRGEAAPEGDLRGGPSAWRARLVAQIGRDLGPTLEPWLLWWARVRLRQPLQFGPACVPASLEIVQGSARQERTLEGVTLIGRDPKCQICIPHPDLPRLAARILRLHQLWVVVAEQSAGARVLEPDRPLAFHGLQLVLRSPRKL